MADHLYWADLHNHNEVGYAQGTLGRSYDIARGALLDVYAFTPHGRWADLPAGDAKMADYHRAGFERVQARWAEVQAAANTAHCPGAFVAFNGFEWHSSASGDYHVLLPGDRGELYAGDTPAGLKQHCRDAGAIMIPHHVAYAAGWRGADWAALDPDLSPVVDVFSEHGCGMEAEFNAPMLAHSMGGVQRSQTAMAQLRRGLLAGLLASTDNHFGHPASFGEGLAAIRAKSLTREAVLDAIRRRHTYAVTGDRIGVDFRLGDAMMGDIVPADAPRTLRFAVDALAEIDYVRIIRNGRPAVTFDPPAPGDGDSEFVVRLDFGWDAMSSREVTDWRIRVAVDGGEVTQVAPCFAGGAGSVQKLNSVTRVGDREVELVAFTSRLNARPTSGVALRLSGRENTRVGVEVSADYKGATCGCGLSATLGELLVADRWAAISDLFSAPKIRLGRARRRKELSLSADWTDPAPRGRDWYLLKVQQADGQAAWTSPIWCGRP